MAVFPIASALGVWVEHAERNKQDLDLLSRIQRRDDRALALLYDRYVSVLYTMAFRIVPRTDEAEEILQEVFVLVWTKANLYLKERGSVYSWLVSLCRNKAVERARAKRYQQHPHSRDAKLDEAPNTADLFASRTAALNEYQEVITTAKSSLSDIEAKIIDLSYFGGYGQTEISQMLKMPLGAVKTKLRQGVVKLRQSVTKNSSETTVTTTGTADSPQQAGGEQPRQHGRRRRSRRGGRNRRRGGQGPHGGGNPSQNNSGQPGGDEGGPTS